MNPLLNMITSAAGSGNGNSGINWMQIAGQLMSGGNAQQIVQNLAQQNPQIMNLVNSMQGKSVDDIKLMCENHCKANGIDFNSAMQQIMQGLK